MIFGYEVVCSRIRSHPCQDGYSCFFGRLIDFRNKEVDKRLILIGNIHIIDLRFDSRPGYGDTRLVEWSRAVDDHVNILHGSEQALVIVYIDSTE